MSVFPQLSANQQVLKTSVLSTLFSNRLSSQLSKFISLTVALFIVCIASLFIGAKSIPPSVVIDVLLSQTISTDSLIIIESRLPRTLTGLFVGSALAVAGCLIQSITRNPLADPGILGVNSGASFFVLVGVVVLGNQSMSEHLWLAFLGAMITSIFVYLIGTYKEAKVNPLKMTLAGVAIGALLAGVSSSITLVNPIAFDEMRFWDAGSLDIRDLSLVSMAIFPILVGIIAAIIIAPALDNISLGEDIAQTLGTNVKFVQLTALFAIALLCGSSTAIAGPIGFIGLMIPHIARRLSGPHQLWLTLYSIVLGPLLIISADIIGRIIAPNEIRVSIMTAFVGAPVLIYLARKVTTFGKQ
ncbi:ferric enterobactin transport system permease protein fepD [Vibrio metschnikovii]|uniref:iron chelate uptake ABC transporter family permease subunit n=1 Tax=Vibrio metschnikovii TaxID=28172 RepID=UPI0001B94947|nr:iron chelate uptake ABC transporter family permease subunit [Vibrio metschnikovii]EEX36333.1 ferric enterobactin transport system permease protein fepD [Vibrio metschnikovii CIP 69.14]SUP79678.1 ferric enterobactin transport system permease protein fepD [Vibrio metschnikovii]SUQ10425.1 ferric enterobactin transport system permease protein fepD [Vibrio metschnikovii]